MSISGNSQKPAVIITEGHLRASLAPVRQLARAGYEITVTADEKRPERSLLAFCSRFPKDRRRLPGSGSAYADSLAELCREKKYNGVRPVILPAGRQTTELLSRFPQLSQVADFTVPTPEAMEFADDKARVMKKCAELSITVPRTYVLAEYANVQELADDVTFPAVVKYRDGEQYGLHAKERIFIARDKEELIYAVDAVSKLDRSPVIQDYLRGHDFGTAVIMSGGRAVSYFSYESLREFPLSGGPTCLCRTSEPDGTEKDAERLLASVGYSGIAMMDFRVFEGKKYLLEINPRVWASANLCDLSDASFFEDYIAAATGNAPVNGDIPSYRRMVTMSFSPQYEAAVLAGGLPPRADKAGRRDGLSVRGDRHPYFRYLTSFIHRK